MAIHDDAFALAVRLVRGETLELEDERGRRWRAYGSHLDLLADGRVVTMAHMCTFDVAMVVAHRGLRPRSDARSMSPRPAA